MPKKKILINDEVEIIDVVGYKPHSGQTRLNELVIDRPYKYYTFPIGRQWGKTKWAINIMLFWAINEVNSNIYYVSPTNKLANLVFKEMFEAISESGLLRKINKTSLIFEFHNGSVISFHSGERPDNLRGATISHLILDEFAYTKKELWEGVLKPACLIKGKKICFISTPAGRNHFHELFLRGKSREEKDKLYCSYTARSHDNPYMPKEELEEAKSNELFYRQEYLAEFLASSLSVFKNVEECIYSDDEIVTSPEKNIRYYFGIDLANKEDWTVCTCYDQNKKVVDMLRVRHLPNWDTVVDYITEFYNKWKPVHGFVETNFNESVYEDLKNAGCKNLHPLITGNNKTPMINDLIKEFGSNTIRIPKNELIIDELNIYTYRFNKSNGKVHYSAPRGFHDDIVMSLAFGLQSLKTGKTKGKMTWSVL